MSTSSEVQAQQPQHVIDCDVEPFVPYSWGWTIRESDQISSRVRGQIVWKPNVFGLYLSKRQQGGEITGFELRKELNTQPILTANVLDYLLYNTHLIPDECKDKKVFFWGTIYRGSDDILHVRYLDWISWGWDWSCFTLYGNWDEGHPAAVFLSNQVL